MDSFSSLYEHQFMMFASITWSLGEVSLALLKEATVMCPQKLANGMKLIL
jgi:hypothetical protein